MKEVKLDSEETTQASEEPADWEVALFKRALDNPRSPDGHILYEIIRENRQIMVEFLRAVKEKHTRGLSPEHAKFLLAMLDPNSPEKRAYEERVQENLKAIAPILREIDESERITAEDLAIVINY